MNKNVVNIEILKNHILELKNSRLNKDTVEVARELENLLEEREQDKKRIQELEISNIKWEKYCGEDLECQITDLNNKIFELDAEREQDKRKIKELEADLYSANITIEDLTDSIPRKKVEDKIEELKRLIVQLPVQHMKKAQIAVLQELL